MAWLSELSAAVRVGMSPRLLRWFTSYAPKGDKRKLAFRELADGSYEYDELELAAFDKHLRAKWPAIAGKRPNVPSGIHEEVKIEAACGCGLCQYMNKCEAAHIDAVATSLNNHPHNLLFACPNHHTEYDQGHRVLGTVDATTVKTIKKELLEARLRRWRVEARAENALLLLVAEAEELRERLKKTADQHLRQAVERQANEVLSSLREAAKRPDTMGSSEAKQHLVQRVSVATAETLSKALEEVTNARHEYLTDASEVECPLCKGHGGTRRHDFCPACEGSGSLDREAAEGLDLSAYETVDCPLCERKGSGKGYDICPVCGGEGELTRDDANEIELSAYDFVGCPLCDGKGSGKGYETCPACGGQGEMPRHVADEIDVKEYEFVDCPLCEGKGHGKGYETCPVCGGEGQLPKEAASSIDLTAYAFVNCRLCDGKGYGKGHETCPACGGEGQLPKNVASEIDWAD